MHKTMAACVPLVESEGWHVVYRRFQVDIATAGSSQALLSLPQRPNWIFGALGFATLTYSHGAFFPSGATLERRILR